MEKKVILHSGGLDSTTVLAIAISRNPGAVFHTLTVDYGQRHHRETAAADAVVSFYKDKGVKIERHVATLALSWKGSALLGSAEVPTGRDEKKMSENIPVTYVPARNTFLLGLASSLAEAVGADAVYAGFNAIDYSGYPDCRPQFVTAFQETIRLGTKAGVEGHPIQIVAPIVSCTKKEVIELGLSLGVPYDLTWSCYKGGDAPCGLCDSCIIRTTAFSSVGMEDPWIVRVREENDCEGRLDK
jgi:7-cyano-7-deazaguanine synthase